MDLGSHAGFILASYGLCLLTVLVLIAWIRIDKANLERALKELAEQGVSRRRPEEGGR
ncbi:heme exporter protein CcmD [uncultured Roseibium sp.]|uniref:heme exporter protein CcmD n=1 Tax=uncultured Roseibium sp. TaxID=1936171 RepID=UPI00262079F9|nr:heme exporter protein CcmD [uncultured Roseibium sp.]